MARNTVINLGKLVLSLSDAMELVSPALTQHQQRTAYVVLAMGKKAKFSNEKLEKIAIAALLHDIGAFSVEEKIALRNFEVDNIKEHCIRGELLFREVPWLTDSAPLIRFHHTEWQEWGKSDADPIVLDAQILFLADYLERQINRDLFILHQHEDIIAKIKSLSGSALHPQIVDLFCMVSHTEEFWLDLVSTRLYYILFNEAPFRKINLDFSDIHTISELFRNIIDFRSRFTSTHSSGVAACASMLGRTFGLTDTEIGLLQVAGNLHDIGKLAIPNNILEKAGKLTTEEMSIMKSHTYYTYYLLNNIAPLQHIAEWAAYHHEKLDGSGYPFHCKETELTTEARILAVADIFTALTEDRPYRNGMSKDSVIAIMRDYSKRKLLDSRLVTLLCENYNEIAPVVAEQQALAREFYESQFTLRA